jgi:Flp pilus assembly protein TadG
MHRQGVMIKTRKTEPEHLEHREQGQALVEFALLITFLTFVLMGVLAFGIIFTNQISLFSTANLAARKANLNDMRYLYCEDDDGHLNSPIYDTVINNMGGLDKNRIHDILIFIPDDATGNIRADRVDVLDADGAAVAEHTCYDYNHNGTCDCSSCSDGGENCVDDVCAGTLKNEWRCPGTVSIGVEVRYDQDVVVPIVNAITGDVIVVPARVVMHIED